MFLPAPVCKNCQQKFISKLSYLFLAYFCCHLFLCRNLVFLLHKYYFLCLALTAIILTVAVFYFELRLTCLVGFQLSFPPGRENLFVFVLLHHNSQKEITVLCKPCLELPVEMISVYFFAIRQEWQESQATPNENSISEGFT